MVVCGFDFHLQKDFAVTIKILSRLLVIAWDAAVILMICLTLLAIVHTILPIFDWTYNL